MVASCTTTRTSGWRGAMVSTSTGTSQRAVVPIRPMRPHAGDLVAHRGHVGGEGVELGLDAAGPLDHDRTLLGDLAGGPVDERDAELLLQAGDVGRHVRLHGVQGPGGGREAAVVDHGEHGVELAQVHRSIMMARIANNCWTDRWPRPHTEIHIRRGPPWIPPPGDLA